MAIYEFRLKKNKLKKEKYIKNHRFQTFNQLYNPVHRNMYKAINFKSNRCSFAIVEKEALLVAMEKFAYSEQKQQPMELMDSSNVSFYFEKLYKIYSRISNVICLINVHS